MAANAKLEERRAFDQRASDLIARAMVPGSPLSCLDASSSDQVAIACEKLLFSSPDSVASAVSYVAARLALISDGIESAGRSELAYDSSLNALRRGLEADRFGIVAHVLSQQADCTPQQCEALASFRDANRVRVNLQDKPFEALVSRYAALWQPTAPRVATGGTTEIPRGVPLSSKYELPSSRSIPAVDIMAPEPGQTASAAPATTASASANGGSTLAAPANAGMPPPPRRIAVPAPVARTPAPTAATASAPAQLTPAAPLDGIAPRPRSPGQ
jgi:hypothetical protein